MLISTLKQTKPFPLTKYFNYGDIIQFPLRNTYSYFSSLVKIGKKNKKSFHFIDKKKKKLLLYLIGNLHPYKPKVEIRYFKESLRVDWIDLEELLRKIEDPLKEEIEISK